MASPAVAGPAAAVASRRSTLSISMRTMALRILTGRATSGAKTTKPLRIHDLHGLIMFSDDRNDIFTIIAGGRLLRKGLLRLHMR
jgi:hypothetical protein